MTEPVSEAFDRAEFDELLQEVVALREWKAAQEAVLFAKGPAPPEPEPNCICPKPFTDTHGHGGFGWSSDCPVHRIEYGVVQDTDAASSPAECELEAITALLVSAVVHTADWRERARYLFDRGVRIQVGTAGTGAAPPDQDRIELMAARAGDASASWCSVHDSPRARFECVHCFDELAAIALRGGAAQPPPSAPSLPDTFVERAIQMALIMNESDKMVRLSAFEASYIRQKYAERNSSGVPREEATNR